MAVIIQMGDKNKQKNAYGEKLSISTRKLKNDLSMLTEEQRYDLVLNSHDGTFVTADGEDLKYTLINKSWESIKDNKLIPAEVRQYWALLPIEQRAKSISQYRMAMVKLSEYMVAIATQVASQSKGHGDARRSMEAIMPALAAVANQVAEQIMAGSPDAGDPLSMNRFIMQSIDTHIKSVDPTSLAYHTARNVMAFLDPADQTWHWC